MLIIVSIAVALVAFIVYALERKSKSEPIVWYDALKLSLFGGLVSAGVVFATTAEVIKETVSELPLVQDMFVGSPSF